MKEIYFNRVQSYVADIREKNPKYQN